MASLTLTAIDVIRHRMKQAQADYPLKTILYDTATREMYIEETDLNSRTEYEGINGCWGEHERFRTVRRVLHY